MKIVSISDTHGAEDLIELPEADMIIFGGDFENRKEDTIYFLEWFSSLDYKYKIMIAGNHDSALAEMGYEEVFNTCRELGIIYLQDTSITIEGIVFHGSPWSVEFCGWNFMEDDLELDKYWQEIPLDTQVLITHGPEYRIGDLVYQSMGGNPNVGSRTLSDRIKELHKLEYHLVGHIHEAYGEYDNGTYTTFNSSTRDYYMKELNKPHVFEVHRKDT